MANLIPSCCAVLRAQRRGTGFEANQGSGLDSDFHFPGHTLTSKPSSPYQKQVALHWVTAAERDLEDGALSEQGVGGVHNVILQAQALVYLPQALQPLLETGHTFSLCWAGSQLLENVPDGDGMREPEARRQRGTGTLGKVGGYKDQGTECAQGCPLPTPRTSCLPSLRWLHWSAVQRRRSCPALLQRDKATVISRDTQPGIGAPQYATTTTRHSPAHAGQHCVSRKTEPPGVVTVRPLGSCVIRYVASGIISAPSAKLDLRDTPYRCRFKFQLGSFLGCVSLAIHLTSLGLTGLSVSCG